MIRPWLAGALGIALVAIAGALAFGPNLLGPRAGAAPPQAEPVSVSVESPPAVPSAAPPAVPPAVPPAAPPAASADAAPRGSTPLAAPGAPDPAPHLQPLLDLPPEELEALVADPAAAHARVQGWLADEAERAAFTELATGGVTVDHAALERAIAAARAARPR